MDFIGILCAAVILFMILVFLREPLRRLFSLPKWDFFVSHRSLDNDQIKPIVELLRRENVSVWCDTEDDMKREILRQEFRSPIALGIQNSSFALLFTSKTYCESHYCIEEAEFFLKRFSRHPEHIIEIQLEENDARQLFPALKQSQWIEFYKFKTSPDDETQYIELVKSILLLTNKAFPRASS